MKKVVIFGCLSIIVVVIGVSIFIGYKVSSAIAGTGKPRDLGIQITAAQADEAQRKTGVQVMALDSSTPLTNSMQFEGSKPVSFSMDSKELTGLALVRTKYKYFPFHSVQIRVNDDNSVEVSGLANTAAAITYATALGYAPGDIEKVINDYNIPRSNVSFYVKGAGSVINSKVSLDIHDGQIAGIPVPMGIVNSKKADIINLLEDGMRKTPGFEAKSMTFSGGKVHFDGSLAETERIVQQ